jgi:CDP-diacylglycerol--glycerol-3-phosphate 3-phosphatidyltransferase
MQKDIPNILTYSRIVIVPILVASFYLDGKLYHYVAAGLFALASITDFFDGYLARMWKAQSSIGKFLDPVADKLLVAAALIMLAHFGGLERYDIIAAVAIMAREILVSGLREFLAGVNVSVPVSQLAKIKTAIQMTAIFLLLLGVEGPSISELEVYTEQSLTVFIGRIGLWIAAILTSITGYAYLKAGLRHIRSEK